MTSQASSTAVLLGFDYGLRRIGIAVGNRLLGTARPLTTLQHKGEPDWSQIATIIREWRPEALIVGLPLLMDGSEQALTAAARRFARQLQNNHGLPVHHADERLTSVAAETTLRNERAAGRKRRLRKEETDSLAASIILQDWMQQHP